MTTVSRSEITITNVNDGRTPYFHTAYTNSTDFGGYDYSGRPNLAPNVGFNDFYNNGSQTGYTAKDEVDHIAVTRTADAPPSGKLVNLRTLLPNKTYTLSVDIWADMEVPSGAISCSMRLREGTEVRTVWALINKPVGTNRTTYNVTFTTAANFVTTEESRISLWFNDSAGACTGYLGYNIKIEEGSTATLYQPNLLNAPWYFSTVPLGENIADPTVKFPITSSSEGIYAKNAPKDFVLGETYTVTIGATKPASQTIRVYLAQKQFSDFKPVEGLVDTWVATVSITQLGENAKGVYLFQTPNTSLGSCTIKWLKIEKGDTRTPNIDDYKYLGNYTDFEQSDSLNPTKYSWSLIKGADGETSYVHTAYAWSADGTDRFTKVYPNENLFVKSRAERTSSREFVNSPDWDMAPIIDKYGVDREYSVSFDLKSKVAGGINVYSQNGSGTRYDIGSNTIQATTEYKRYSHTFKPKASNMEMKQAMLAFYGTYGTGRIPSVKNVKFELGNKVTIDTTSPKEDYENAYPSYTGVYSDFNVEGSDNPKDYTWARSMGSDGESAKTLILSTSSNTVKINQDSSIQSDTITLQANMQNMTGTATFSAIPYIGTTPQTAIELGGAGNTRTFSTSSWNKNWTSLVVTATFESFIDKQTIISVREGKDGADSITGLLTNESVTLPADKDGIVESFSEASGTFKIFDGLSDVTGKNVAYKLKSSLGGTFNINASTGVYNMTAMSKDSAIAVFEATYKNIKIEKILSVAKSKAGNDSTSYSLLLSSQVMSLPRGASKLVPENITISGMAQTGDKSIENIKSRIVVEETTNGTTWTTKYDADALTYTYTPSSLNVLSARVKMYVAGAKNVQLDQKSINIVKDGSNGSNGSSSYTWVRYSENANGNPMTTTPNSKTKYIGIAITQTSTAPSSYSNYTWSRIKGSGGLVAKVYSNGGTNIEQSPIQINVETQSDGDIVEPDKVTWYMSKDSSVEWTAIKAGNGITLNKKYIIVEPVVFLEANSISFKAQVEYNSMAAFDYMTVNNKSFDAMKPLILRQPAAPLNPYPGLLWLDTSSGSGDPLDETNPSLVYRWGKSAIESIIGTEYAHYAYANTPTGYQEDGVTPDPGFSVTYNSRQKPMYIGYCVTDTEPDPTTPSSYNWKSITTENGSEDVNGARGIAQEKTETTYKWGWVVLSASDLKMLPWLNNEDGSTIIDWIYQITQKTSDDSIVQTVVGSEDMSKVYAKTDAVDELSSANHELSDKLEEYNKQIEEAFAGIDTTYVNKSEFEQEMNKFNFGIDKAGGVNLIRNSTGFQWEDTAPSDEMLTNPKFEGTISTTGLDNGWVYNDTGMGQIIGAENDLPEYKIMRIGGTNSRTKYSYSKNIPVTPGQLINISGQARIPNTIGDTQHIYVSIRFYGAASNPSANSEADTIGNGQGFIYLFTDKKHNAGSIFGTDSYTVKTNNIVQDIWSNYSVNVTIPSGAAFMKICLYNSSTTVTDYFDFRKPSVVLYSGMFDFWHKNDSANAQIRQILGDESLEELGLIAGFELKGLRYKLDQDILLPNPNTEYTLSWYANKISRSGKSKYYVKVLNTKTGAEIAVSEASADTIGYQRMSVTFSVTNTSAVTIRIGLEGEGSADATLSAAGLMINIGPYPLSWQSHHEEVYSTNVRIDSSGLKVFNSDYDGYNVMTPREFAGYYRNGEVYERVFTLNKDTTKVKKLEAQERFMMKPVQIVSVDSPTIQGWAFVGYNGEDTD